MENILGKRKERSPNATQNRFSQTIEDVNIKNYYA